MSGSSQKIVLGAVAVMDVEVEDREPRQLVHRARLHGADGDIVEHAEAHGLHRPRHGGRAGAWRRTRCAASPAITASTAAQAAPAARSAASPESGFEHGVGIDPDIALRRHAPQHAAGVALRMDPLDLLERRLRRLAPLQARDRRLLDRPQDRLQPHRRFGMARAGIVLQGHGWV